MKSAFSQLSDYLARRLDVLRIRKEQFETDVEAGRIEPGGFSEVESGLHAMDFHYTGTLLFERLPAGSLAMLLLLVTCWLFENDGQRQKHNLAAPDVAFFDLGDGLLDVAIEIAFVDAFHLGESPDGGISLNGKTYGLDAYELAIAERGEVNGGPTDA